MSYSLIIPDASVLLKWVLHLMPEEKDVERALTLRRGWIEDKYKILLPGIWLYEVSNVLGCKVPDFAGVLVEKFIEYPFDIEGLSAELCRRSFRLMKKHKVAFYDAVYHSVAIKNDGLFVTADEAYYKKVKAEGHIVLLKDFTP